MRVLRGDQLHLNHQAEVLRAYCMRHTSALYIDDQHWLETHTFHITSDDRLSRRHKYAEGVGREQYEAATARAVLRRMGVAA